MVRDKNGTRIFSGDIVRATFENNEKQLAIFRDVRFNAIAMVELGNGSMPDTGLDNIEFIARPITLPKSP